jgi:DNA-binding CsgD family transcriptional regulator/uncharacterized protein YciI
MLYVVERTFHKSGSRLQEVWPEHLRHLRSLAGRGALVGGGPWEGGTGEFLIVEASDEVSLHRLLRGDPLVRGALVAKTRIRVWSVEYGHFALIGKAPRERAAKTAGVLTPHESRIAEMVVSGMTNQEIADELNVSCRAIEQHLTRMYRKLSIRRRAQLATALAATTPHYGIPQEVRLTA